MNRHFLESRCSHAVAAICSQSHRLPAAVMTMLAIGFCPWHTATARADPLSTVAADSSGNAKLSSAKDEAVIRAARNAVALRSDDEGPVRNLVDALARTGRKGDALAEADRFAKRGTATAALRAQRGFLRLELKDFPGAIEDFTAAIAGGGLTVDQRRNVQAGIADAQATEMQGKLDSAQADLIRGNFMQASSQAGVILASHPNSEPAMRIRVESLAGAGKKREALTDADQFLQRAPTNLSLRAQRGFLRRELNDMQGAADDFSSALGSDRLAPDQRRNVEAGLNEVKAAASHEQIERARNALKQKDYVTASRETREVLQRNPNSEEAIAIRMQTLSDMGHKREAAAEADRFIALNPTSSTMQAQRGYLRRELHDTAGAIEDFTTALAGEKLSAEQRQNVQAALVEAQKASTAPARAPQRDSSSRPATYNRIDALSRAGRKREAQAEAGHLIAQGQEKGWLYAQRGFARFDAEDFKGAIQDFDAALRRRDLDRKSIANIRYTRAVAKAKLAESEGSPQAAVMSYREYLQTDPSVADAWFNLGYLLLKQRQRRQGADALISGLELRPVGPAYLDAANAYILMNAPLASKLYRQGLDRWYAGDKSFAGRSQSELERIKNEVVEADASIRTTLGVGGIAGRPESAGGKNLFGGAETSIRFDGRYLPSFAGLEAFTRGFSGKDSNGVRETDGALGLRYRPIPNLNLYVGGAIDHFLKPESETEFVLNWGLGLGSDPYPYSVGWKPYWDFGTVGSWRTADGRVLEDVRANAGLLYEFRAPVRGAIGPTLLAVAGYDNKAGTPWAGGIGPSVLSYMWLGGDNYRSYDALLSLQIGYVFNVGDDERQRGWRAQIGLTF